MLRKRYISSVGITLLLLASCQQKNVFNSSKTIENKGWHKDSIASFKLPVLDSVQKHHIFINIRNTNAFPFSNLYLIAQINYPKGKQQIDTLQYQMATPSGQWLGSGASSIKENKLWYAEEFQFSESGEYNINIRHAMRTNGSTEGLIYLKGISDVGIQIETAKQQR